MTWRRAALIAICLVASVTGQAAHAQTKPAGAPPPRAQPAKPAPAEAKPGALAEPEAEAPPPPYEPQLLRLAEIMGALAFLRPLCGASDGSQWRARMASLIEAEANSAERRDRLAGAFNKGYRGYGLMYRRCTPAAELVIARYLDEGGRLTRDLTGRFGG